jgi:hypothetical protein
LALGWLLLTSRRRKKKGKKKKRNDKRKRKTSPVFFDLEIHAPENFHTPALFFLFAAPIECDCFTGLVVGFVEGPQL